MVSRICVVGLGYVGMPLAMCLDKHFDVVGVDVDSKKVEGYRKGVDSTGEADIDELKACSIDFTSDPAKIKECDFVIVCVPTPIDGSKKPDLQYLESASRAVGENLKEGSVVVYESTVYPGVTEVVCAPIIEESSGFKLGEGFKLGYSPERVNPGDKKHSIDKVVKIVAGSDQETLDLVDSVYSKITNTHKAPSIKVAEAAKVIENIQRDLNIALMNELALIFDKLDININDVLNAAGTKWNFHKYHPGMVGGHCIGVDPYYLTYKAESVGYDPKVILAGRKINDDMHNFYADKIVEKLEEDGKNLASSRVMLLGLTFKPNVSDYRNSRVKNLIESLKGRVGEVMAWDPFLEDEIVAKEFGVENVPLENANADLVVIAVKHKAFEGVEGFDLRNMRK